MIELSHIEKRFGDNQVLRDISLRLAEGKRVGCVIDWQWWFWWRHRHR